MKLEDNTLEYWEAFTCKDETFYKKIANCSPYFTALQYINNLETQMSPKTTLNLENLKFLKNLSSGLKIIR